MTERRPEMALSEEDRERVHAIERLGADAIPELVATLDTPSWPVRRAAVAALARAGEAAFQPLAIVLLERRENEARLAAAVDALSVSPADPAPALRHLAERAPLPVVCDVLQVLGRRKARGAVEFVGSFVSHSDDNVAVAAIEALSRIGGPESAPPLLAAIHSKSFFRTFATIDALGRIADPRAIAPLAALLDDPAYAMEAARALGRTGEPGAVLYLAKPLGRASYATVRTTALALSDLHERHAARVGDGSAVTRAFRAVVSGTRVVERIAEVLSGAVLSEQVALIQLLGWVADATAAEELLPLLDGAPPIAAAAAQAIRESGDAITSFLVWAIAYGDSEKRRKLLPLLGLKEPPVSVLIECLQDPLPEVRTSACEILARAGDTSAVPPLFALLADPEPPVVQAASAAIQSLGSTETRTLALRDARSSDPRTRRAAMRILAYFGYNEALDLLVEALADPDEKIRESAIQGLALSEEPRAQEALLRTARDPSPKPRAAAIRAIGHTAREPSRVLVLTTALTDPDPWVRYYACQSIAKLRIAEATPEVIARMNDEAGQVRVAAVETLGHLRTPAAVNALALATTSSDPDIRRAALGGLGIARDSAHLPVIRVAALAEDAATRLVAVSALAQFETDDVIPDLAHAARDPDVGVASGAIGLLSTRPGARATEALLSLLTTSAREDVFRALAVGPALRIDGILSALEQADETKAPLLASALVRMRRPSAMAALATLLDSENVHARRAVAHALVRSSSPDAEDALRRALGDLDPEVQRIAGSFLQGR